LKTSVFGKRTLAAFICLGLLVCLCFAAGQEEATPETLDGIVITSLPETGTLYCGSRALLRGEGVAAERLDLLRWESDGDAAAQEISWLPVYADGRVGAEETCSICDALQTWGADGRAAMSDSAGSANTAPIAQELALETYRGIALSGTLPGIDPDGEILRCEIVEQPVRGVVTLGEDGSSYVYTPYQGETGRDRFTFTVTDSEGAVSAPAEVVVEIEKPRTGLVYSDMQGNPAHYAAIRLAEEGIYTGVCVGGRYYLEPDEIMTRGEMVSLAVAVSGRDMIPAVNTSYADDEAIPVWVKPFAVTALQAGIARGMDTDGGRVLDADTPITKAEAAVMLDAAAGLQDAAAAMDDAVPAWAQEAWRNVETLGVLDGSDAEETLTRGEALQAVYNAWSYVKDAETDDGFFSWIA